jgi:threonine synthase
MISGKFEYQCCTCHQHYPDDKRMYLCPVCARENDCKQPPKGILKLIYAKEKQEKNNSNHVGQFVQLKQKHFLEILPVCSIESFPKLRVGNTPLYTFDKLNGIALQHHLLVKDDSQNPTYSFKDRASALVSAFALENKLNTIIAASTGNAGSSLAGICASQQQKSIILVPENAPLAKLSQIIMYGARLVPVKGSYDDAFDLSVEASNEFGWYNRNTAYNPLTVEGKKTVSFELFEQLGYSLPDLIFVPVGDGVIISGIYKGFEDLMQLGIIDQMPVIVAVQAAGSNNLIRNLFNNSFELTHSNTLADSISVDIPRNFYLARDYILNYKGGTIEVTDKEIMDASVMLSKNTGLFAEPASAAAFAGYYSYYRAGRIKPKAKCVVMHTGSGLKDIQSIKGMLKMPQSIYPEIEQLSRFLNT